MKTCHLRAQDVGVTGTEKGQPKGQVLYTTGASERALSQHVFSDLRAPTSPPMKTLTSDLYAKLLFSFIFLYIYFSPSKLVGISEYASVLE